MVISVLVLTSAIHITQVREPPHVAKPDGIAGHCKEVVAFVRPVSSLFPLALCVEETVAARRHLDTWTGMCTEL